MEAAALSSRQSVTLDSILHPSLLNITHETQFALLLPFLRAYSVHFYTLMTVTPLVHGEFRSPEWVQVSTRPHVSLWSVQS